MISQLNLRDIQQRLRATDARLTEQIAQMEKQKADLFQQGVEQPSVRVQTILAQRIRDLDQQCAAIDCTLQLIHKQSLLLAQIVYARENADRLSEGLLAGGDWDHLLESMGQTKDAQEAMLERLDEVLGVLEQRAGSERGPMPQKLGIHLVQQAQAKTFLVTHIPDGDGLELEDGTRVRYIGIDAPEISSWDGQPEAFAEEAKAFNGQLVLGKRVRLMQDTSDTDRYGRLLRYVYVEGTFVNAELVRAGLARALDLWPNDRHAEEFLDLEQAARKTRRGMWKTI